MNNKAFKLLLLAIVTLAANEYARSFDWLAEYYVQGLEDRPYVYRTLIPSLAHLLWSLGLSAQIALRSCWTFRRLDWYMLSTISLQHSKDRDLQAFMAAALAVPVFLLVFMRDFKVYDIATAAWFALSIGLLARGKLGSYYLLFPIGCLNRETAFLMTLLFIVYFARSPRWAGVMYQAIVYVLVRALVLMAYADQPGVTLLFRPVENIHEFAAHPVQSVIHWTGFALITWLCLRNWSAQPRLLRQAFLVFAPALMMMYLFFGVSFEIRVFAEIYPVIFGLIAGTH